MNLIIAVVEMNFVDVVHKTVAIEVGFSDVEDDADVAVTSGGKICY